MDAFVPELWAQESQKILEENMVIANLIHRDFGFGSTRVMDRVRTQRKLPALRCSNETFEVIRDTRNPYG
jgi:hypothetical protein